MITNNVSITPQKQPNTTHSHGVSCSRGRRPLQTCSVNGHGIINAASVTSCPVECCPPPQTTLLILPAVDPIRNPVRDPIH